MNSLPLETLDEIASYLGNHSLKQFAQTCRIIRMACERRIWNTVSLYAFRNPFRLQSIAFEHIDDVIAYRKDLLPHIQTILAEPTTEYHYNKLNNLIGGTGRVTRRGNGQGTMNLKKFSLLTEYRHVKSRVLQRFVRTLTTLQFLQSIYLHGQCWNILSQSKQPEKFWPQLTELILDETCTNVPFHVIDTTSLRKFKCYNPSETHLNELKCISSVTELHIIMNKEGPTGDEFDGSIILEHVKLLVLIVKRSVTHRDPRFVLPNLKDLQIFSSSQRSMIEVFRTQSILDNCTQTLETILLDQVYSTCLKDNMCFPLVKKAICTPLCYDSSFLFKLPALFPNVVSLEFDSLRYPEEAASLKRFKHVERIVFNGKVDGQVLKKVGLPNIRLGRNGEIILFK